MSDVQEAPKRKLASIQKIASIRGIPGADKVEVSVLENLGWEIVTRKGEFKAGELVVYCEVDCQLPEKPEFEFLRERKFRIKTIKLRGTLSQGIVFPLTILPNTILVPVNKMELVGTDVSESLDIRKYDPQLQEEKAMEEQAHKSKVNKFFMQFGLYRFIYFRLNKKNKGWPGFFAHTDEENLQNCLGMLTSRPNEEWYVAEKIDGKSFSAFIERTRKWGRTKLKFGVCSRNIRLSKPDTSDYWKMAKKYDLENKLLSLNKAGIVIQAEIAGGKVQGNKYALPELDMYVFNVIEGGERYSLEKMKEFCLQHGLKMVPILYDSWVLKNPERPVQEIVKELLDWSNGKSVLNNNVLREGLVLRLKKNTNISFKIRSPDFLIKFGE